MPGLQIFKTLRKTYGTNTIKTARKWENLAHKEASSLEQLHFLHSCKRLNILPNTLNYRPPIKSQLAKRTATHNGKRMLNTLITETHNRLRNYRTQLNSHQQSISTTINNQEMTALTETISHTATQHRQKRHNDLQLKLKNCRQYREKYSNTTENWGKEHLLTQTN